MNTSHPAPTGLKAPGGHSPPAGTGQAGIDWVLVAGASDASLYERDADGAPLRLLRTFSAPTSVIDPEDLRSHDPAADLAWVTAGTRQAMSMSPQRRRHLRFAGVLAAALEEGLAQGRCASMTLVAACPFLGALRRALSPVVRRAATRIIDRDLCDLDPHDLADALRAGRLLAA